MDVGKNERVLDMAVTAGVGGDAEAVEGREGGSVTDWWWGPDGAVEALL